MSNKESNNCGCDSAADHGKTEPRGDASYGDGCTTGACGCSPAEPVPEDATPRIDSVLTVRDRIDHFRCRISSFRDHYRVEPGLYCIGNPGRDAGIFVSANYRMSFNILRSSLAGIDAWILVLDTKGINVWCAAGKGTFGTGELITRMISTGLAEKVDHRRVILPQLGAVGVAAHIVQVRTGFRVLFGPVDARDLPAYVSAGYRADKTMRTVRFGIVDRLVLTPMEIVPALRYFLLYAAAVLVLSGLTKSGIVFAKSWSDGWPLLASGFSGIFAGSFLTPLLLPYTPFRPFALKGAFVGAFAWLALYFLVPSMRLLPPDILGSTALFSIALASFVALQFTGSTTFTSMTGVKQELKVSLPFAIVSAAIFLLDYLGRVLLAVVES